MKKSHSLFGALIMLFVLFLTSCSSRDSKMANLLDRVPADVDIVAVGNLKTILESAGGSIENSKITLPAYILDEFSSSDTNTLDEFNSFLKDSGIDPDACAIVGNYKDAQPVFVFSLTDKKKFTTAIEKEGFSEKSDNDGTVMYTKKVYESESGEYDDFSYIAINGTYAYWIERVWVGSNFKAERAIDHLITDASSAPYSKTSFAKYITSGNAAGASFKIPRELRQELEKSGISSSMADFYKGVVCMKGNLTNDDMTITFKWFDEDGKEKDFKAFGNMMDFKAKINPETLAYLGEDEALVCATSFKDFDWDNYLKLMSESVNIPAAGRAALYVVKSYLEKIDGTIAFGIGLTNGMESVFDLTMKRNPLSQIAYTLVIDTKKDAAQGLLNDVKGMMEATGMSFEKNAKGFTWEIPGTGMTIFAQAEGNRIIVSSHKIRKSNDNVPAKSFDFDDYMAAAALSMNKDSKILRDLNIKNDIQLSIATDAEEMESTLKLEVKGGDSEGVIAKTAKILIGIAKQQQSFRANRGLQEDLVVEYGDIDSVVVEEVEIDTIAVEEAVADPVA